jgi:succinate dehydrogenase flavin-adding protein (antitoxin of CptAB toxin-antitoxin module)
MKKEEKQTFRTNKKRNSALLYEFLMRHISKCIIEDKKDEANKSVEICKKFFSEGSPLRNELKLFQSVVSSKVSSRDSMNKIIEYACKYASLMNSRILDQEKAKLIKEINYTLSKGVYDYKVPEYVTFSSLQTLFNESRNKQKKLNGIERIRLQDGLVGRLMDNAKKPLPEVKFNPNHSNAVYKILVNKFHEKYASRLTENQKKFLIQYTSFLISEDKDSFNAFVNKENSRILSSLTNIKDPKLKEDKELNKKINECVDRYKSKVLSESLNDEKVILEFLQYIKLADEVVS